MFPLSLIGAQIPVLRHLSTPLDLNHLIIPGDDVQTVVAENPAVHLLEDEALGRPLRRHDVLALARLDLDAAVRERDVLERLGPVDVSRDADAALEYPRRENMRLIRDIVDLASNHHLRPISGSRDILLDNNRPKVPARLNRHKPQLNIHLHLRGQVTSNPDPVRGRLGWAGVHDAPVVVVALDADDGGKEGPLDGVEAGLPAEVVVDDGPRGGGPAVVQLPDEGAAAAAVFAPLAAPAAVGVGKGFTLRQLAQVRPRLQEYELHHAP